MNMMGSSPAPDYKFVKNGTQQNATRIPDEEWEKWKAEILELFQNKNKTLKEVEEHMENTHGFKANKRQYVHRLGEKWGIKKYKSKPGKTRQRRPSKRSINTPPKKINSDTSTRTVKEPSPKPAEPDRNRTVSFSSRNRISHEYTQAQPTPLQQHYTESDELCLLLAEMLSCFGDFQSAFQLYYKLYTDRNRQDLYADCARTAQTESHAAEARKMLQTHVTRTTQEPGDTWENFYLDLMSARTFDRGNDKKNALGQFEESIDQKLHDDRGTKRTLKAMLSQQERDVDVPLLQYLCYALRRYNEATEEGQEEIDIEDIIDQFLGYQPAIHGGQVSPRADSDTRHGIPCLHACLAWCIRTLEEHPDFPQEIEATVSLDDDNIKHTYQVLCTLWRHFIDNRPHYPRWTDGVRETQLGISPTALLAGVICTIMSTPDTDESAKTENDSREFKENITTTVAGSFSGSTDSQRLVSSVLRRAKKLASLEPMDLINRFLFQMRRTGEVHLAFRPEEHPFSKEEQEEEEEAHEKYGPFDEMNYRYYKDDDEIGMTAGSEPAVATATTNFTSYNPVQAFQMVLPFREFVINTLKVENPPEITHNTHIMPLVLTTGGPPRPPPRRFQMKRERQLDFGDKKVNNVARSHHQKQSSLSLILSPPGGVLHLDYHHAQAAQQHYDAHQQQVTRAFEQLTTSSPSPRGGGGGAAIPAKNADFADDEDVNLDDDSHGDDEDDSMDMSE